MPRIATLATLVALLVVGTGCGDSGDPRADPTAPATTSATTEPTPTEPTEPTEPTVEPATGPILDKLELTEVRAPEGWTVLDQLVRVQQEASDDDTSSLLALAETENFAGRALTLDEHVDIVLEAGVWKRQPKVLPTVELDGVEAYHLAGQVEEATYLEEFGVSTEDRLIALHFEFAPEVTPEERQEVVDSVLATFRWK